MKRNLKFYIWNYVLPSDWTLIIGLSTYNWKLMPEQVWTFWPVCLAKKNVHNYSTALMKEVYFSKWTLRFHEKKWNQRYFRKRILFPESLLAIREGNVRCDFTQNRNQRYSVSGVTVGYKGSRKGQLISKCLFGVIVLTKKPTKVL
jgi:hypothetical protein